MGSPISGHAGSTLENTAHIKKIKKGRIFFFTKYRPESGSPCISRPLPTSLALVQTDTPEDPSKLPSSGVDSIKELLPRSSLPPRLLHRNQRWWPNTSLARARNWRESYPRPWLIFLPLWSSELILLVHVGPDAGAHLPDLPAVWLPADGRRWARWSPLAIGLFLLHCPKLELGKWMRGVGLELDFRPVWRTIKVHSI